MWSAAVAYISDIFKPAADLIDELHTSDEERLKLRNILVRLQNEITTKQLELLGKQMDLEKQLLEAQTSIISAEAKSDSWLARNWRPITTLTFVVLIVFNATGLITLQDPFASDFMSLVQIAIGGYVAGRSAEKAAPALVKALGTKVLNTK